MKIAVAIADPQTIAPHMRSTKLFMVFDAQVGEIAGRDARQLPETAEGHDGFLSLLADCSAVIGGGMGSRVAEAFSRYGIEPVVAADVEQSPEAAALGFLDGTLQRGTIHACCCEH